MKEIPHYETLMYSQIGKVATVTLHQPGIQNALNNVMIQELYDIFSKLQDDEEVKCIVFTGIGKSFCLGFDLSYLSSTVNASYRDNLNLGQLFAKLLYLIYTHPKPIIAKVNGNAVSEGVGLLSVCDIVIANEVANFCFCYVKLGLVPAIISPYIVRKVGDGFTREYFLTGEQIPADKALKIGLVNHIAPEEKLDEIVNEKIKYFLSNDRKAIAATKEILSHISLMRYDELLKYTAEVDAEIRMSDSGREGVTAFIEKRTPDLK